MDLWELGCKNLNWISRSVSYSRDNEHPGSITGISQTITNQPTPWSRDLLETLGHLATRETLHLLWNLKVYCFVHKSLPTPRPCVTFYYMLYW
jgi:hypothetical protein